MNLIFLITLHNPIDLLLLTIFILDSFRSLTSFLHFLFWFSSLFFRLRSNYKIILLGLLLTWIQRFWALKITRRILLSLGVIKGTLIAISLNSRRCKSNSLRRTQSNSMTLRNLNRALSYPLVISPGPSPLWTNPNFALLARRFQLGKRNFSQCFLLTFCGFQESLNSILAVLRFQWRTARPG